jgi:hypothetical protein
VLLADKSREIQSLQAWKRVQTCPGMLKKLFPALAAALLLAGCTSTRITNLTPSRTIRSSDGFYPVEAALSSGQQSLRWETIKPQVLVDNQFYPMRRTQLMTNRWEALVPIPAGRNAINYRFKFDYDFNAFGTPPKGDSKMSKVYRLQVLEK